MISNLRNFVVGSYMYKNQTWFLSKDDLEIAVREFLEKRNLTADLRLAQVNWRVDGRVVFEVKCDAVFVEVERKSKVSI